MKRSSACCPVLTYHSQIVSGNDYARNDHIALASDLELIQSLGLQIIPLLWLTEWLLGERQLDIETCVCISFDDGADSDVRDLDFPGFGRQRGFLNIMTDFQASCGDPAQPSLHATAFVIASPQARAAMDRHSLFDQGWMGEEHWRTAQQSGLMSIGNHSWDHEHPDLGHIGEQPAGNFFNVDNKDKADRQIAAAGAYIAKVTGSRPPRLFAYPYGQVSNYLRDEYLPNNASHTIKAAFTTVAEPVHADSDRWQLGRFVCGNDWQSTTGLKQILLS